MTHLLKKNYRMVVKKIPCMMDPVISGLSLESPCKPSLGMARLINPERHPDTITALMTMYSLDLTETQRNDARQYLHKGLLLCQGELCQWVPPSCHMCVSVHGQF